VSAKANTYYMIYELFFSGSNDAAGTGEYMRYSFVVDGGTNEYFMYIAPPLASKSNHLHVVFPHPVITDVNTSISLITLGTFHRSESHVLYREVTVS